MDRKFLNTTQYHRVEKHSNFTVISNELIKDSRISTESRLIMIYILSKPDKWIINQKEIMNTLNIKKYSCNKAFKELKEFGYIKSNTNYEGKYISTSYDVYENGDFNKNYRVRSTDAVDQTIDNTESISYTEKRYTLNEMKLHITNIFKKHNYNAYRYNKKGIVNLDNEFISMLTKLTNIDKQNNFLNDIELQVKDITSSSKQFSNENYSKDIDNGS